MEGERDNDRERERERKSVLCPPRGRGGVGRGIRGCGTEAWESKWGWIWMWDVECGMGEDGIKGRVEQAVGGEEMQACGVVVLCWLGWLGWVEFVAETETGRDGEGV